MTRLLLCASLGLACFSGAARGQLSVGHGRNLDSLSWHPSGTGIESAVVDGDPAGDGQFTIAFRFKAGALFAPHFHSGETRFVVIRGDMQLGFGDSVDTLHATTLHAGGLGVIPALAHHFEAAKTDALIVLFGPGPLRMTLVHPGGS